jgi:hypothetical protein
MTRILSTLAAAAVATSFAVSMASASTITIMIDNFTDRQSVYDEPPAGLTTESTLGGLSTDNTIGGVRHLKVETDSVNQESGTLLIAQNNGLSFNNAEGTTGTGWLILDGTTDMGAKTFFPTVAGLDFGASVNTDGLNADLLMGFPTGYFRFSASEFDHTNVGDLLFSAFAWDMDGRSVGYFEAIDPFAFDPVLWYHQFQATWGVEGQAGFDWGNVGALAFRVQSTTDGFDGRIGPITAHPIPLPASALLLLGGLGGLAGWSAAAKRRRKAA